MVGHQKTVHMDRMVRSMSSWYIGPYPPRWLTPTRYCGIYSVFAKSFEHYMTMRSRIVRKGKAVGNH
jgi:hypothetical protein